MINDFSAQPAPTSVRESVACPDEMKMESGVSIRN